ILATAAVVVLNPVELLRQARDSQRLADLDTVAAAISLWLADEPNPSFSDVGPNSDSTGATSCFFTASSSACTVDTDYDVDGTGWVGVNFTQVSGGSPIETLPRDPVGSATYFYAFFANDTAKTFELNTTLESTKFATDEDLDGTDGGDDAAVYEVGNDPGLDL
ncbi:MAG: hypothetical protein COT88_01970, partial [Candidatus Colwellbacteria bacterium CG10_big_fil_rev_8_21_14_0_10_41_28]